MTPDQVAKGQAGPDKVGPDPARMRNSKMAKTALTFATTGIHERLVGGQIASLLEEVAALALKNGNN